MLVVMWFWRLVKW